mgnify:CR=1 FL=1
MSERFSCWTFKNYYYHSTNSTIKGPPHQFDIFTCVKCTYIIKITSQTWIGWLLLPPHKAWTATWNGLHTGLRVSLQTCDTHTGIKDSKVCLIHPAKVTFLCTLYDWINRYTCTKLYYMWMWMSLWYIFLPDSTVTKIYAIPLFYVPLASCHLMFALISQGKDLTSPWKPGIK